MLSLSNIYPQLLNNCRQLPPTKFSSTAVRLATYRLVRFRAEVLLEPILHILRS